MHTLVYNYCQWWQRYKSFGDNTKQASALFSLWSYQICVNKKSKKAYETYNNLFESVKREFKLVNKKISTNK